MTNKSIEQTYLVLDEIDHIRKRTGMYAGSTSFAESEEYTFDLDTKKMVKRNLKYIPALIKVFSEILDNSIDESKRASDTLKTIRVDINQETGVISVFDDGRGIPVKKHAQTGTYVPETVFSNLRAGSNFNDDEDQSLIGTNGVGSTICNVLSESFTIETADKSNFFKQTFSEGMRKKTEPTVKPSDKNFTRITFTPYYKFFKLDAIDKDHFDKMVKKVVDAAGCNTNVKFYINGQKLVINNFADYISYYVPDGQAVVYDDMSDWKVGFTSSSGFEQVSFVNSVETYQGGTHVYYAWIQVANKLREYINKKHKVDVKPTDIQAHLKLFISCNINRPKFSSQTKENMVSPVSEYKTSWEPSDKFIKKIIASDVIQLVLDWVEAKAKAEELRKLRELNKEVVKSDPRRVEKFSDAMEPKDRHLCECYLTEGDCIDENMEILRVKDGEAGKDIAGNIKVGNLVLTHKNRYKKVTAISYSIKELIEINTPAGKINVSSEHRLLAYSKISKEFIWIEAGKLDVNEHQLTRSTLVDIVHAEISNIDFVLEDGVQLKTITYSLMNQEETYTATLTHKFSVFDVSDLAYKTLEVQEIDPVVHFLTFRYKYNVYNGRQYESENLRN